LKELNHGIRVRRKASDSTPLYIISFQLLETLLYDDVKLIDIWLVPWFLLKQQGMHGHMAIAGRTHFYDSPYESFAVPCD